MPLLLLLTACAPPADKIGVPGTEGALKTAALERAERRAYDGAPPVVPHENFGMTCTECHDLEGMEVEGVGFAPPSPHAVPRLPASGGTSTLGMSAFSRCRQCHVFSVADGVFQGNAFADHHAPAPAAGRRGRGLPRRGHRAASYSPGRQWLERGGRRADR